MSAGELEMTRKTSTLLAVPKPHRGDAAVALTV